ALDVDIHVEVEVVGGEVLHVAGAEVARDVDHDVDAAERLVDGVEGGVPVSLAADVEPLADDALGDPAAAVGLGGEGLVVDIGGEDLVAAGGEGAREVAAYAAGAACQEHAEGGGHRRSSARG